jgi:hypothetical protein
VDDRENRPFAALTHDLGETACSFYRRQLETGAAHVA